MEFAQIRDRVEVDPKALLTIDPSSLIGTWVNSNTETNGITRMIVSQTDDQLLIRTYAIGPAGVLDWGNEELELFAASASSRVASGFSCRYDFGFGETRLQGMIMKGLLVLAQFHSFKDTSKRAGFFVREYYALDHGLF
ncbi:MAG TPA: hypothetical protein VNO50_22085 [Pyrinomonadaceae bacterium]|nr:hypothetical protein [Pyrinomonadaceae bacterium]